MAFGNLTDQLAILRRQDLTSTEKFVAVVALSFRNSESGRCNPPIVSDDAEKETLCSRSGYTKQCITKTLASLEAKGVIALKKAIARPSEITFTVNDVYGKRGLPSTTITATVNDVYGKGKQRLPITDKEQIKNRQVLIGDSHSMAGVKEPVPLNNPVPLQEPVADGYRKIEGTGTESCTRRDQLKEQEEISNDSRDLFDDSDQKANRGAPKTEKTQRNSLIPKANRGAPLSESKPAESTEKTTSKPLMQKKNKGADVSKRKSSFCTVDRPQDVSEQLWTDFLTHRKAKKAPVTETVISRTRSQARLCGMTLAEALEMTVARGWQGFEARYVLDNRPKNQFCPDYRESTPAPNPAHNPFIPRRAKTPEELQAEKEQREAEELFGGLFR